MLIPKSQLVINRDSKWVRDSARTWQLYSEFLSKNADLSLEDKIITFLFQRYNENPKLIRPKNISNWAGQLFEQLENENIPVKPVVIRRVKKVVSDWERFLLTRHDFGPKQPKYMSLKKLKELSWDLWRKNRTHRCKWLYRAASVAYVYAWLSGGRMQDILRLKWEDMKIIRNNTGTFLMAKVRHSKGNKAKRGEQLTVMLVKDHTLNIFSRLKHWWAFSGKPKSGLVFRKVGNKAETNSETGQQIGSKKLTGISGANIEIEIKPFQIKKAAQRAAVALGWSSLPMAKSGRNSIVPVLLKLGVKSQLCNIFMRWSHSSEMLSHYQGAHLEFSTTGVAYKIGKAIESGEIYELEKDIH